MKIDPQKYHRRSMRLKGFDYSQPGAYFITLVTHHRECLFGEVVEGEMWVNQYGKIVQQAWMDIPFHYPWISLEAFVVMPNYVHGIVFINEMNGDYRRGGSQTRPHELGNEITPGVNQTRPYKMTHYGLLRSAGNREGIQIILCTTDQPGSENARGSCLAAILLRPYHPY